MSELTLPSRPVAVLGRLLLRTVLVSVFIFVVLTYRDEPHSPGRLLLGWGVTPPPWLSRSSRWLYWFAAPVWLERLIPDGARFTFGGSAQTTALVWIVGAVWTFSLALAYGWGLPVGDRLGTTGWVTTANQLSRDYLWRFLRFVLLWLVANVVLVGVLGDRKSTRLNSSH